MLRLDTATVTVTSSHVSDWLTMPYNLDDSDHNYSVLC